MASEPLNLISEAWLPVSHKSGACSIIRPAQIVEGLEDDPIVGFAWPRADFRIASFEFLIGLVATACPPADYRVWPKGWRVPPSVEKLDEAFARVADAFWLDGPGPRFLQDYEDIQSGQEPVERLLIDAPGESTVKRNADLFVHRGQIEYLARAAAAMALFTLQSWAPSGGAGNMTGLRGGGPLTTLVLPSEDASLWEIIWANVPAGKPVTVEDMEKVFPWMAPTVISGKAGTDVRAKENAHPLQCWWGMPRRIRLDFEKSDGRVCNLTGQSDDILVSGWRQRPYGPKYAGWIGMPYGAGCAIHPLTPRYRQKKETEWLAVHPQPGGIGYRHWAGVVAESADQNRLPASCVANWRNERADEVGLLPNARLLATGFDMDNMKARSFVESEMPLPGSQDPDQQKNIDSLALQCVGAATQIADILRGSVREALFGKGTVSVDVTLLSNVRERFWAETEASFFALLRDAAGADSENIALRKSWLQTLARVALQEFDATVILEPDMGITEAQRSALARRRLGAAVSGRGKEGEKIRDNLGIPAPVKKKQKATEKVS
ncbi:type I-E CRISPR-associated protein Cse1/CasA [Acetobacter sp. AAB5]|uniref:type I-E CRISPR-associated protein Cse1/CasA n=1 Tax=Acetobacter sp. AAB5 TaxID=3418370 RepID=UPI003CE876D3